jgi:hypothetical protein
MGGEYETRRKKALQRKVKHRKLKAKAGRSPQLSKLGKACLDVWQYPAEDVKKAFDLLLKTRPNLFKPRGMDA